MIIKNINNLTMCWGKKCDKKDTCFRYINHSDAYSQVRLFPESPFVMHNEKQFCPKYINIQEVEYDTGNS